MDTAVKYFSCICKNKFWYFRKKPFSFQAGTCSFLHYEHVSLIFFWPRKSSKCVMLQRRHPYPGDIETKTRTSRQRKHPKSSVSGPVCLSADLRWVMRSMLHCRVELVTSECTSVQWVYLSISQTYLKRGIYKDDLSFTPLRFSLFWML